MKKTNQALTILGGLGAGAALMYFLDPDRGTRRRALVRDKAVGLSNDVKQNVTGYSKHLKNRATGMYHEARSLVGKNAETGRDTDNRYAERAGQLGSSAAEPTRDPASSVSSVSKESDRSTSGDQVRSFGNPSYGSSR